MMRRKQSFGTLWSILHHTKKLIKRKIRFIYAVASNEFLSLKLNKKGGFVNTHPIAQPKHYIVIIV